MERSDPPSPKRQKTEEETTCYNGRPEDFDSDECSDEETLKSCIGCRYRNVPQSLVSCSGCDISAIEEGIAVAATLDCLVISMEACT
ncbi:hypothetical protein F2Q70_00014063 [Brassica cretica]|uniref:Uncharacterized protein n=1 Tax=Brassica cretica TaxID=69181 RepID=A0A8S9I1L4_BRACR|nr:hypothetical protein F2Q70_00014063 [Brassica cretica]